MPETSHPEFPQPRFRALLVLFVLCLAALAQSSGGAPAPLLNQGHPVDWWFVFKFNSGALPECGGGAKRLCAFGGSVQAYKSFGQQFAFASSASPKLQQGSGCVGDTTTDPLGATFDQIYNGKLFYVVWNDQFYGDPMNSKAAPAGHSKGVLAWDQDGNGVILQVSTPSWPASGNSKNPRKNDGNTLGCVTDDNVLVSQHFFALRLNKEDLIVVLKALGNASVVTDPDLPQIVNNGGPADVQELVKGLGQNSTSTIATSVKLSTGVVLISKPSRLQVPPWQMVSALLEGQPLRVASWWTAPKIPSTAATTKVGCWDDVLGKPGAVEIAKTGTWDGKPIGLLGLVNPKGNHAKLGVSTGTHAYTIFGDMNQQGALAPPNCGSSQNGRGGLFYVVQDQTLTESVRELLKGDTAP